MNRLGDLHCELAGGYEDQRPHGRMLFADDPDALEERQRKGRGFPGAGRRLSENVAPRQQRWNRLPLNGGGLLVSERRDRSHEGWFEAEAREGARVEWGFRLDRGHDVKCGSRIVRVNAWVRLILVARCASGSSG